MISSSGLSMGTFAPYTNYMPLAMCSTTALSFGRIL